MQKSDAPFWQEYAGFWANRERIRFYVAWLFFVCFAAPVLSQSLRRGQLLPWRVILPWAAGVVAFALAGAVLIVANDRLKRHQKA